MLATERRDTNSDRIFPPKPSYVLDSDDIPLKLSAIARAFTFNNIKKAFRSRRFLEPCLPERSPKRRRVLDSSDMPREGKPSPRRRQPSGAQSTSGSASASPSHIAAVAREAPLKSSLRDGEEDGRCVSQSLRACEASSSAPASPLQSSSLAARDSPRLGAVQPKPGEKHIRSPEAYVQARIHQRRAELIRKLMAIITPWLDKQLAALEAACDGEGGSGTGRSTHPGSPKSRNDRSYRPAAGQKRQTQNRSRDSDEEDNGDKKPPKANKRTKTATENHQKFACPYYKRFPEKFRNQRTCSGPGWDEVHRMKEHLDRRHRLPKYRCKRCCEYFQQEKDLEEHQRMDIPCAVGDRDDTDPSNGFDEKKAELMSRKKSKNLPDVDRWKEIYTILFDVEAHSPEMPTPYYDASDAARTNHAQYKAIKPFIPYCRQQAPKVIQQALETELDRGFISVEHRIKSKLNTLVLDVVAKLLSTYEAIGSPEEAVSLPDPNAGVPETDEITSSSALYRPELSSFLDFDEINFEITPGFDDSFMGANMSGPQFGSHCEQSLVADSAYYTRSTDEDSTNYLPTPTADSRYLGANY